MLRKHRSHDQRPHDDAARPLARRPSGGCIHFRDRPCCHLAEPAEPHTDHEAIPGVQLDARIADDPAKQARILIRLPDQWNGKLVVAGASGTRSEFNGDFAWSDFVLQKGYAYLSQNKGVLNFYVASLNSVTQASAGRV